jgi:hypothetical protein
MTGSSVVLQEGDEVQLLEIKNVELAYGPAGPEGRGVLTVTSRYDALATIHHVSHVEVLLGSGSYIAGREWPDRCSLADSYDSHHFRRRNTRSTAYACCIPAFHIGGPARGLVSLRLTSASLSPGKSRGWTRRTSPSRWCWSSRKSPCTPSPRTPPPSPSPASTARWGPPPPFLHSE